MEDARGRTPPLRPRFEEELAALRDDVLRMGAYVAEMLDAAMDCLASGDAAGVERVVGMDDAADRMDREIEQSCLRLLALQQPMSRDLRTISTALKIIADLERIGDFSVDIAKTARRIHAEGWAAPPPGVQEMARCVKRLLREVLHAFINHDLESVRRAVRMDDEVDGYYDRIFTDLLARARQTGAAPPLMSFGQLLWYSHVIHFLERIADHAVNVAERVYYMETGEFEDLATSHQAKPPEDADRPPPV